MPRKKLTTRFCDTVKVDLRTDFQDEIVKGLSFRVTPNGVKTWTMRYVSKLDGSRERLSLGRFPALTLDKARKEALKLAVSISEGNDPASGIKSNRNALTVKELGELFIEKHAKRNKKTWPENQRILNKYVNPLIGQLRANSVKKRNILDVIEVKADEGRIAQSTQVLAVIRKMFNWAVDEDYIETTPVAGVKPRGKPVQRDRVLSDDEIFRIWNALPDASMFPHTRNIIRLLFLTGQRSGEVCGIVKTEIDFQARVWNLPSERTKNSLPNVVPLSDRAYEIIKSVGYNLDSDAALFSRISKPIDSKAISRAVRLNLQILDERWTPHDIRRTVATRMADIGTMPHVIEACLNHISGFRSGVAGIYNRSQYEPEKRQAFDRWGEYLFAIIDDKKSFYTSR